MIYLETFCILVCKDELNFSHWLIHSLNGHLLMTTRWVPSTVVGSGDERMAETWALFSEASGETLMYSDYDKAIYNCLLEI